MELLVHNDLAYSLLLSTAKIRKKIKIIRFASLFFINITNNMVIITKKWIKKQRYQKNN